MKKIFSLVVMSICATLFIVGCSDNTTYAKLLEAENTSISNFIKRNNINIIANLPANNGWGTNDYYKTSDGFYIHIVDTGQVGTEVQTGQTVLVRYIKMGLDLNNQGVPDTILNTWTTSDRPYPDEVTFNAYAKTPSAGFQQAISIMKRHNAVAKIIVPSKLGTEAEATAVIPYFYDFKIKLIE